MANFLCTYVLGKPKEDVFGVMNKGRWGVVGNDVSTSKLGFWRQPGQTATPHLEPLTLKH